MLTREETLRILRKNLPRLSAEFGVKRLALFGSVAEGAQNDASDIDLIAEFDRPLGLRFVEFTERLEGILGANVDVLTPTGVSSIRNRAIAGRIRDSAVYV